MKFNFITATRLTHDAFQAQSPLFHSLKIIASEFEVRIAVTAENTRPLADTYNAAIESAAPEDVLIFVHDDVWISDWMITLRLEEAFKHFDVVGVAGSAKDLSNRESWIHDEKGEKCHDFASGAVAHGVATNCSVNNYGPTPREVKLLDGVLLACSAGVLQREGVLFDPAFPFHFYDMDFCRKCASRGVKMGTWPIALVHRSGGGGWRSDAWNAASDAYRKKWGNT